MKNLEISTPPNFNPTEELMKLKAQVMDLTCAMNIIFDVADKLAGGRDKLHALLNTDKCST